MALYESDAIAGVTSDDIIIDEMVIRLVKDNCMVTIVEQVVSDDTVVLVYSNKTCIVCITATGDGKVADVGMWCINGDDGVGIITVDDGVAPVFSK